MTKPSSAIALANLDAQIARETGEPGIEDLLLLRARFLSDDTALDRAVMLAESGATDASSVLRRARARSAVHRFQDALEDVESARRPGAVATGKRLSLKVVETSGPALMQLLGSIAAQRHR